VIAVTERALVVAAHRVTKWFGATTALDGVDMTVPPGVVHGLLGPNGAGKTTLLAALFGLVLPDEGTLRLFGRTRAEAGPGWLDGVGGFVETPRFYPYLTGRQNLAVLAGLDGRDAATLIDQAIESAGLSGARRQKVRGYSLGMRQRLGLAADGMTVLLSSHDMAQVEEICDSVTVLHHGKVVFAGGLSVMRADAPDGVWQLRTSDDVAALRAARDMAGVKAAARDEGGLTVHTLQDRLDDYVLRLGQAGISVRGLELEVTPLESLFFQLTQEGR
jgi:ABC-2 type transport system ATP-binding protein